MRIKAWVALYYTVPESVPESGWVYSSWHSAYTFATFFSVEEGHAVSVIATAVNQGFAETVVNCASIYDLRYFIQEFAAYGFRIEILASEIYDPSAL